MCDQSRTNAQLQHPSFTFLQSRGEMGGDVLNADLDSANISHQECIIGNDGKRMEGGKCPRIWLKFRTCSGSHVTIC